MENAAIICFEAITTQTKKPLFIAIAGDSGSGKSYLVSLLEVNFRNADLPFTLINHDEFLIPRLKRELMKKTFYTAGKFKGKSHWEVLENMFRLDEYEKVISDLKSGLETSFFPYSRKTGDLSTKLLTVKPADFIMFDTSMMLDVMDFVILVDATQENIISRKLARDSDIRSPEQIIEMHKKVQGYYWEERGKPARADIIVNNNDFNDVKVSILNQQ